MIQAGTYLNATDNSGAKRLQCIGIPGSSKRRFASLGDIITCAVIGANPTGIAKDHTIVRAIIVRTKKEVRRPDGSYIRFDDNAAIVVDKDRNPIGSRVFGPVSRELRDLGFMKIVSMASEVW